MQQCSYSTDLVYLRITGVSLPPKPEKYINLHTINCIMSPYSVVSVLLSKHFQTPSVTQFIRRIQASVLQSVLLLNCDCGKEDREQVTPLLTSTSPQRVLFSDYYDQICFSVYKIGAEESPPFLRKYTNIHLGAEHSFKRVSDTFFH